MTRTSQYFTKALDYAPERFRRLRTGTKKHPQIVRYFNKTPRTIVCPHFYELNWAYGCNFNCSYCYLQGTLRGNKRFRTLPVHEVLWTLQEVFDDDGFEPSIFNSGELTDSLGNPSVMKRISDKFEEQNRHRLLLLTKSADVDTLADRLREQTIASFSINAPEVSKRWERGAPPPQDRIEAARRLSDV
ncbi:MAG: radical SAM protein, partial [Thermoplasmata archaeon]|nr:radical SAM protein [Thermoplasmata archaeon]